MNESRRRRSRFTLILVAVLFLSPFLVALTLNRLGWHPDATRNHGTLVEPPQALGEDMVLVDRAGQSLPLANLAHRWTLLVRVPASCGTECQARLDELHRVRYSLSRHAPKLAIRLLAPAELPAIPESMSALDAASIARLEATAPDLARAPDWTGFLVDDKAYLMLRFPPELEARLIRRDLGRLIK